MSIFACSDLHGHYNLYKKIKDFLQPEDEVVCLGDCGDRGPQSWETIKAVAKDPQWTYLMGNHEHMLVGAMLEYRNDIRVAEFLELYPHCGGSMQVLCAYNGGIETLQGWVDDGAESQWINFLLKLPTRISYRTKDNRATIHLSHAGFTPNRGTNNFDLIWDRTHFEDKWPENMQDSVVVHGHTPCQYFKGWKPEDGAIWYAGGHKIDIDMGTPNTKQCLLLDLDTFDEHIFYDEGE